MKSTIGGNRLGSGKKMTAEMHGFERSTHDLSYIWRNTQAPGTLVPFMVEVGLPGDTFDIDLNANVLTHPTVGPLYGSYKVQMDIFTVPFRLYNRALMINQQKIGLTAGNIKLPQYILESAARNVTPEKQINPSSIFAYLGARGLGRPAEPEGITLKRAYNAIPLIGYYDIYKNYYANQQEERGAMIHTESLNYLRYTRIFRLRDDRTLSHGFVVNPVEFLTTDRIVIRFNYAGSPDIAQQQAIEQNTMLIDQDDTTRYLMSDYFDFEEFFAAGVDEWDYTATVKGSAGTKEWNGWEYGDEGGTDVPSIPKVKTFALADIDTLIAQTISVPGVGSHFWIGKNENSTVDLRSIFQNNNEGVYSYQYNQEGLLLKTYQNDLFNNWMKTEWIQSISAVTQVSTAGNVFNIDALNLANKVYNMLTRIALSGGTYYDYLETSYDEKIWKQASTPIYQGGLSKELVFQEVVANSASQTDSGEQVLGQLGGRGVLTNKHKGGQITVRINEPSYIMGIVSLTPRIDYSQGNRWDVNLKSIGDLHTPGMDQIGFQDLITDKMATFDTIVINTADPKTTSPTFRSAGKQPAWIDYMTNYNRTFGNFALKDNEMFMTLNRNYEVGTDNSIKDLTSYIDPAKYNFIFAETSTDAMNFWVQIASDITARRKMSAKIMPNL